MNYKMTLQSKTMRIPFCFLFLIFVTPVSLHATWCKVRFNNQGFQGRIWTTESVMSREHREIESARRLVEIAWYHPDETLRFTAWNLTRRALAGSIVRTEKLKELESHGTFDGMNSKYFSSEQSLSSSVVSEVFEEFTTSVGQKVLYREQSSASFQVAQSQMFDAIVPGLTSVVKQSINSGNHEQALETISRIKEIYRSLLTHVFDPRDIPFSSEDDVLVNSEQKIRRERYTIIYSRFLALHEDYIRVLYKDVVQYFYENGSVDLVNKANDRNVINSMLEMLELSWSITYRSRKFSSKISFVEISYEKMILARMSRLGLDSRMGPYSWHELAALNRADNIAEASAILDFMGLLLKLPAYRDVLKNRIVEFPEHWEKLKTLSNRVSRQVTSIKRLWLDDK